MAKFEVELELQGFRLKVKAEREADVSRITDQIGKQLTGFTQPFSGMVEAPRAIEATTTAQSKEVKDVAGPHKSVARTTRKREARPGEGRSQPITWHHDTALWGTPRQAWTAMQKILWIVYVIGKVTGQTEIGGPTIAESFNKSFKQFGPLTKKHMPRDLGVLKTRSPAQVMDNTTASPITWYLTETGIQEADRLVAEARGAAPESGDGRK